MEDKMMKYGKLTFTLVGTLRSQVYNKTERKAHNCRLSVGTLGE